MYDAIVVGMGPAGAVTAADLGRAGLSVLALEGKALPRYKVCGGGLSARIDHLLDPDYRQVVEETIDTVRFQLAGAESFQIASPDPIAYMVMRDRFDAHLVQKARAAGVQVREGEQAVAVFQGIESIEVATARGRYRARMVVGADGAFSVVARSLFSDKRRRLMSGLEGEVLVRERPPALAAGAIVLDIGVLRGGYAWVFPKEGRLSLGVAELHGRGRSPKGGYDRFVRGEPILDGLEEPRRLGHPLPLYAGATSDRGRLATDRALLVGDAAHLVDPLFGEGIYYAVLSGQMAARSIIEWRRGAAPTLHTYDEHVSRHLYPEFRIAARLAWAVYTFPHSAHHLLRRRPDIVQRYYDVLKGHETYQSFYAKVGDDIKASFARLLPETASSVFSR